MTDRLTLTHASASIAIRKTEQRVSTADELFEIAIQTLSQAVEMLREDVERERAPLELLPRAAVPVVATVVAVTVAWSTSRRVGMVRVSAKIDY